MVETVPLASAALLGVGWGVWLGWSAGAIAGVAALALLLLFVRPDIFALAVFWPLTHTVYRVRVLGRENVPAHGPALLISNHISHFDACLMYVAQRRVIRFVIWALYLHVPLLRVLLRLAKVIPIDSRAGPRALIQSLRAASEALDRGELVCVFAEGGITRTGYLQPFQRGFEQILKHSPVPVIPVYIDQMWGSVFSYSDGRFFWKLPRRLPYPATVIFGKPLPPTVKTAEVRAAIQKLAADSSIARASTRRPVHREFIRMACRHPFRPCLIDELNGGKLFRYGHALAGSYLLARLLRVRLADASLVGLWLPPSVGGVFANVAVALLGKTAVNLNYTSSAAVVQSAIRQCGIRHVLTSRAFTAKVPLDAGPGVEHIYLEDFRGNVTLRSRLAAFGAVLLLPRFALERWVLGTADHRADQLVGVIFSSGSTGDPKGVMLSHRNLAANTESIVQAIDPGPRDRLLGILPFFHSFGFTVTMWVPLQVGASLVFHPDPRQAKEIGEICRKHRCTILLTTPTFLRFCLRRCQPGDFDSLRILICGAEKLPPSLAEEFKARFGVLPLEGYGCTELSPVAAANVPDWHEGERVQIGNKPGTIGQPLPGIAARVVNPDTFATLAPGQEGLLMMYGGNVMQGYLGRPEATRDVIRDGWYCTGDIARIDEDGYVTITDRLSRFSKIGGEMVPHQKIEDELHIILGTNERAVVVTAVPDERRGERLVVLHTPLNGGHDARRLWQALNTRGLPNLWVPAERDFMEVAELPVLGTGKLDLKRVREIAFERVAN